MVDSNAPTASRSTGCPTISRVRISTRPIPTRRRGTGRRFTRTSSARASIRCGLTRPSRTCLRTARTTTSVRAHSISTCIRCCIPRRSRRLPQGRAGRRALILSRDVYLGAQANGAIFWSSDIYPTWDTCKRQIPTGLDFAASGIAYWSNDTGGWQWLPRVHKPARPAAARSIGRARRRGRLR